MWLKDLLQGRMVRHPLHRILVHFPVGLFLFSLVLDLIRPRAGSWTITGAFYAMAFHDGQVICPWHRSSFNAQTGKVTKGPATVDLRTFAVEVRDGKIRVKVPRQRPG